MPLAYAARQALAQLRTADEGTKSLGLVVLTLAEQVDQLKAEVDRLKETPAA